MATPPEPTAPYTSYKDYIGWYSTGYSTADLPGGTHVSKTDTTPLLNVALVLGRANDPTAAGGLLTQNWATRQQQIQSMVESDTLWSTYGAATDHYNAVLDFLSDRNFTVVGLNGHDGYTTSQDSRTIWVQVTGKNFNELFGNDAKLMQVGTGNDATYYWEGNLTLPDNVRGLWFDEFVPQLNFPDTSRTPSTLTEGIQGPGNGTTKGTAENPQDVAALYNFPLAKLPEVQTAAIGLLEPGLGASPPATTPQQTLEQLLSAYRTSIGLDSDVTVIGVQPGGPSINGNAQMAERSLDIGIATAVNPTSALILYSGSGFKDAAGHEPYTAYFQSIWDTVNNPGVVTSSFHFNAAQPSPHSPFMFAARELFVDAALRNISMFSSSGDGGSSYEISNGLTNSSNSRASPYVVVVGGTSLSTVEIAQNDPTLNDQYFVPATSGGAAAKASVLWELVAGGLTAAPAAGADTWFAEAVWNRYRVATVASAQQVGKLAPGYQENQSSNAGVDYTQDAPWYQAALHPFPPAAPDNTPVLHGRALPDVVALSAGNMLYSVPSEGMTGSPVPNGGTSAATPFWASLAVQINTILTNQGFPAGTQLGFMNDLLYMAAAIAPGSFNDISIGNNVSSFLPGNSGEHYLTPVSDQQKDTYTGIVPTGEGYYAGPGYDVATGLGSPNGVLLARAISAITHSQMFFESAPDLLAAVAGGGWKSSVDQSLLVQLTSTAAATVTVTEGSGSTIITNPASADYAWTSQLAQQVLQHDFDPSLVTLFDTAVQGRLSTAALSAGETLAISINGVGATAYSAPLTNSFGFNDFETTVGVVRVARPVAFAETPLGLDDQTAVVRLRQNGTDDLSLTFYKVIDFNGTVQDPVSGVTALPGDANYATIAQAAAYHTTKGTTAIAGPGYGNHRQEILTNVDASDIIAMKLRDVTTGEVFWSFTKANQSTDGRLAPHIWNYGLNTFGFEDGGGDNDYNDLIVGIDFTSTAGDGWLV